MRAPRYLPHRPSGGKYHKACFVCAECGCTLEGGFALVGAAPYCAAHASAASRKAAPKELASAAAAAAAGAESGRAAAAMIFGEAAAGGDGFTIDVRTGEKVRLRAHQPTWPPCAVMTA